MNWQLRRLQSVWMAGKKSSIYTMDTLNKRIIHVLGVRKGKILKTWPAYSEYLQLKMYELFIFGTLHLIFSGNSWPQITEIVENDVVDKRIIVISNLFFFFFFQIVVQLFRMWQRERIRGKVARLELQQKQVCTEIWAWSCWNSCFLIPPVS